MAQSLQDNQALIWDLIRGSQHEEEALMESHEEDLREVFIEGSAAQGFPELQEIDGNVGKSVPEFQHSISDTQMMQVSSISCTCALAESQTFNTGQKHTCCSPAKHNTLA